jgi:hypothetical protein
MIENGFPVNEQRKKDLKSSNSLDNGMVSPPLEDYAIPVDMSLLDINMRLRIKEAELNIVRRDYSELLTERNTLESHCKRYEESWKFTIHQLGRAIEQRNEALAQVAEGGGSSPILRGPKSPEVKLKKMKPHQLRAELEATLQQLNTQIVVSRQLEHERDKAYDDYEYTKSQLQTVILQHQDLLNSCAELARQRDQALSEAKILRQELNKYDTDLSGVIELDNAESSDDTKDNGREKVLIQQIKLLREQREQLQLNFHQTSDEYKRHLQKVLLEKKKVAISADAMRALLQRKLESSQAENMELRMELRAAYDLTNQLKDQLAHSRISQSQHFYDNSTLSNDLDDQSQPLHSNRRYMGGALSQDTGISLYSDNNLSSSPLTEPSLTQVILV